MERFFLFLPSVLIIASIGVIALLFARYHYKKFKEHLQDAEWLEKNQLKLSIWFGTPVVNIVAPTLEELIFRAPLVIAFSALTAEAWIGIVISTILFGLMHFPGSKIEFSELVSLTRKSNKDEIDGAVLTYQAENRGKLLFRKCLHVVLTAILGLLAGYYGVLYQSIWVAVGIHAAWNLFMPVLIPILVGCLYAIYYLLTAALLKVRASQERKRHKNFYTSI